MLPYASTKSNFSISPYSFNYVRIIVHVAPMFLVVVNIIFQYFQ